MEVLSKKIINIIGNKYGELTIISFEGTNKYGTTFWGCRCSCGKFVVFSKLYLNNKKSKKICSKYHNVSNLDKFLQVAMRIVKRTATVKSLNFTLTKKQFTDLIFSNCFYCGCTGTNIKKQYVEFPHNGIDRINNKKGYTYKNCLPCCKTCNYAKNTMKYKEFISWSKRLYENLKTKGVY